MTAKIKRLVADARSLVRHASAETEANTRQYYRRLAREKMNEAKRLQSLFDKGLL